MMNGVAGGLMAEIERAFAEEYGFGAPPRIDAHRRRDARREARRVRRALRRGRATPDTARFDVTVARDGKTLAVYNAAGRRIAADRARGRRHVRRPRGRRRVGLRAKRRERTGARHCIGNGSESARPHQAVACHRPFSETMPKARCRGGTTIFPTGKILGSTWPRRVPCWRQRE